MNTSNMKNIVILKDLPSNIVEEAIIFLKENQKIKKPEIVDIDLKNKKCEDKNKENINQKQVRSNSSKDYIVNEAQMIIAQYISNIENKDKKENISYKKLKRKYEILKKVSCFLTVVTIASLIVSLGTLV